jgi:hypothetical protein
MGYHKHAIEVLLAICGLGYGLEVAAKSMNVSLTILSVSQTLSPSAHSRYGSLELKISNTDSKAVTIPFTGIAGKGMINSLRSYSDLPGPHLAAEFSTVTYEWCDKTGSKVLSGAYELSREDFKLGSGGHRTLFAPIGIPVQSGDYKLRVRFDNRNLERILTTSNFIDRDNLLLELTAETLLKINN